MAKRNVEIILNDTLPQDSKEAYNKAWKDFIAYIGNERKPTEADFLQYFDYLHGLQARENNEKDEKTNKVINVSGESHTFNFYC